MRGYKKIKLLGLHSLEEGDIVLFDDNVLGIVGKIGKTFLHNHTFVDITHYEITKSEVVTRTYYSEDFDLNEIVFRKIRRFK